LAQVFVVVAGLRGHLLDRLEFLAGDDIHRREKTFELTFHHRFGLAADALRHLGGIGHETREIVEHPIF
jgi:hypothetical protein